MDNNAKTVFLQSRFKLIDVVTGPAHYNLTFPINKNDLSKVLFDFYVKEKYAFYLRLNDVFCTFEIPSNQTSLSYYLLCEFYDKEKLNIIKSQSSRPVRSETNFKESFEDKNDNNFYHSNGFLEKPKKTNIPQFEDSKISNGDGFVNSFIQNESIGPISVGKNKSQEIKESKKTGNFSFSGEGPVLKVI